MRQQLTSRSRPARPPAAREPALFTAVRPGAVAAAALILTGAALPAQTILGAAPSAFVLPRGVVRVGVAQDWTNWDETFGAPGDTGTARVALGSRLSADAFAAAQLAALAPAERDLRQLAGQTGLSLSLGRTLISSTVSTRTTAIELEAGLGRGISFGVVVPVVRTLSTVGVRTNADGGDANVGLNPARLAAGDGSTATAAARNAAVKSQFDAASQQLRQRFAGCFTAGQGAAPECPTVLSLYESATAYATTLARVYGTTSASGAAVVPIAGSAAQRAVDAAVQGYSTRFAALLGSTTAPISAAVQGALPALEADLQALLTSDAAGLSLDSLRTGSRITLGDIEVGLRFRLFDTFRGQEAARFAPSGVNVRSTLAGLVRVGTGHVDAPNTLTDVGTGDGQHDVEVATLTDLFFGARGWLSLAARYGRQLADEQTARVPFAGAGAYLPAVTLQRVDRDLGDYFQLEATPRFAITSAFGVEGRYLFRSKQADVYRGTFTVADSAAGTTSLALDAALLGANSEQREQRLGGAVTYSTYAAYARGRARLPLELSLSYLRAVAGRGAAPAFGVAQLQLRAFPRLFGPDWRAPAG